MNGTCSTSDFALAMLVRQDKCTAADVKMVLNTFNALDIDGSGFLDDDDVTHWIERKTEEAEGTTAGPAGLVPTPLEWRE